MALLAVREVFDLAVANLASEGSVLNHDFGSEHLAPNNEINRYIWVPTEIQKTSERANGAVNELESLYEVTESFDVWILGEDHNTSFAMMQNVLRAIRQSVSSAVFRFAGADWEFPKDGEPMMADGRALIAHCAIAHSLILDAYIAVSPKTRDVAQDPAQPDAPFTTPTSVEVTSSITTDLDADGS